MIVGIDVGTSSIKVALLSCDAVAISTKFVELNRRECVLDRSAQDATEWLDAIHLCLSEIERATTIAAIGLCANCSTIVPQDASGKPSAWALLWNDSSAGRFASRIQSSLRRYDSSACVQPGEPGARYLQFAEGHSCDRVCEAATWILSQLTGRNVLPQSIFQSRWGILRAERLCHYFLADFPQVKPLYENSCVPLVQWNESVGTICLGSKPVPVFCAGNDGLTAIFGTGFLPQHDTAYMLVGTSQVCVAPPSAFYPTDPAHERETLAGVDILFGQQFAVEETATDALLCQSLCFRPDAVTRICVIGGRDSQESFTVKYSPQIVHCGRYAGAIGAAALAAIASGVLPPDIHLASEMLRANWEVE
jgi:sugar (pentulose or hexulose) kinase